MCHEERITLALLLNITEHRVLDEVAEHQLLTNVRVEEVFLGLRGPQRQQKKGTVEILKTRDQGVAQLRN